MILKPQWLVTDYRISLWGACAAYLRQAQMGLNCMQTEALISDLHPVSPGDSLIATRLGIRTKGWGESLACWSPATAPLALRRSCSSAFCHWWKPPSATGDSHLLCYAGRRGQDSQPTPPVFTGCPLLAKTVKPTCHLPFYFWTPLQTAKVPLANL